VRITKQNHHYLANGGVMATDWESEMTERSHLQTEPD
jgi:hypothetical protein